MRLVVAALAVMSAVGPATAEELSVEQIMARVAANQDLAIDARKRFVYTQTARVRVLTRKRKPVWDETRKYEVTPTAKGVESRLVRSWGERREKGKIVSFQEEGATPSDPGLDGEMADGLLDEFTPQRSGRDGLQNQLYPFASDQQSHYRYSLAGVTEFRGKGVARIEFEPRDRDSGAWRGEMLLDQEEWQPVHVYSNLAIKIPLWVRAVFGVSIRQLGFGTSYKRFDKDVWFPVSHGGEFSIKVLHVHRRLATVSVVSEDFRRTAVESSVEFDGLPPE